MSFPITPEIMQKLQKDIPILTAQIKALYTELDKKFHLNGAKIPITFGFDTDLLGSYTQAGPDTEEHFHFSLLFTGYSVKKPLTKEERLDLYKHEYAHYMDLMVNGPMEECHGEGWEACCRAVGAITREEQVIMFYLQNNPKPTAEDLRKPERLVRLIRKHPYFSRKAATA